MELLNKSEYALLAMLALAARYHDREPLQIRQIAAQQQIPDRYLEQLLAQLRRERLIRSERGYKGGYLLAREPRQITLLDVIGCIEGVKIQRLQNAHADTAAQGVIFEIWQESAAAAHTILQQYTLQDLLEKQSLHQQGNLMYHI